jgi:hypothetical protein
MANNESSFKAEFRKSLKEYYGDTVKVWTTNDMFLSGIADFNVSIGGKYYGVEAKFEKKPPVRDTSLVLSRVVTDLQIKHLVGLERTGNNGIVLVGFPDVAVWVTPNFITNGNITLGVLKLLPRIPKIKGRWAVETVFGGRNGK